MSLKIFSTEWLTKLLGTSEFNSKTKTKFQTKTLAANRTASGIVADLTMNGLVAGKVYRAFIYGTTFSTTGEDPAGIILNTDGTNIVPFSHDQSVTGTIVDYVSAATPPFIAPVSGSLSVSKNNANGTWSAGLKITLEELPNHEVTTDWT